MAGAGVNYNKAATVPLLSIPSDPQTLCQKPSASKCRKQRQKIRLSYGQNKALLLSTQKQRNPNTPINGYYLEGSALFALCRRSVCRHMSHSFHCLEPINNKDRTQSQPTRPTFASKCQTILVVASNHLPIMPSFG